jgi:MFS family permease
MKKLNQLLSPYRGLPREIYIIFFARMINAMGVFVWPMMTLLLTKKIGLTEAEAGFWLAVSGILTLPASLIGGKLTDTIGRRTVILLFEGTAVLLFGACAFVPPSMPMVYMLMAAGVFFGMSEPAHNSLIADLTTPENRDGAFSLSYLGFNVGFAIGPLIGGLLFENHLRWFFLGDSITGMIAVLMVFFFVGETIHKSKDESGTVHRGQEARETGSILTVIAKRPLLVWFALFALGYNFVYAQWGFLIPMHMEMLNPDMGANLYGKLASLNGIVVILFTPLITKGFSGTRNIRKIVYGGILYVVGFGMLGFYESNLAFAISCIIFTWGEIAVTISFMPFLANHTPASHRGRMNAVLPMVMGLGFTFGPMVMGNLIPVTGMQGAWKIVGLIAIVSTLAMQALSGFEGKIVTTQEKAEEIV